MLIVCRKMRTILYKSRRKSGQLKFTAARLVRPTAVLHTRLQGTLFDDLMDQFFVFCRIVVHGLAAALQVLAKHVQWT